jgi:hypothetical protein
MKSTKCPACGLVSWSVGNNCKSCGADLTERVFTPPDNVYEPTHQSNYQASNPYPEPTRTLAIVSLVLGLCSFFTLGLLGIGSFPALIAGVVALVRIKRDPLRYGGRGMAIAGVVLSVASLVSTTAIITAIAIPNFLAARTAANENSAINTMRRIREAESIYHDSYGQYGTLPDLAKAGLIDAVLASGNQNGYKFDVQFSDLDDPSHSTGYGANAEPEVYKKTGRRSFYVDETNVIRGRDNFVGGHWQSGGKSYPPLKSDYDPEKPLTLDDIQHGANGTGVVGPAVQEP